MSYSASVRDSKSLRWHFYAERWFLSSSPDHMWSIPGGPQLHPEKGKDGRILQQHSNFTSKNGMKKIKLTLRLLFLIHFSISLLLWFNMFYLGSFFQIIVIDYYYILITVLQYRLLYYNVLFYLVQHNMRVWDTHRHTISFKRFFIVLSKKSLNSSFSGKIILMSYFVPMNQVEILSGYIFSVQTNPPNPFKGSDSQQNPFIHPSIDWL